MAELSPDWRSRLQRRIASLDRDLPPDLDDLIVGKAEEVADMDGVALHHGKQPFLASRQAPAVLAADHRLMADIVGDIVEIDIAAERLASSEQFGNMRTLHQAEACFRAPEIRGELLDGHPVARGDPWDRQDLDTPHKHMLVQRPVAPDMPVHHRRRTLFGP